MNKVVTVAEAKAHIHALLQEVEQGAEITITRHGRPVARLTAAPAAIAREPGDWRWTGQYDPSVFAPMTDDELRAEGWPV